MGKTKRIVLQTSNFLTIFDACKDALLNQKMIVVTGDTGYGKTIGIESFKLENGDSVVIVNACKSMNPRLFFSSIYNEIGDENYSPSLPIYFIIRKAANVFSSQSRNMLLIIDEAGKLSSTMLQYLHEFRELTKDNTGIVLIGVDYFKSHLDSWYQKGQEGIPEFYGRINAFQPLSRPTFQELVSISHANQIFDKKFILECRKLTSFRQLDLKIKSYFKHIESKQETVV